MSSTKSVFPKDFWNYFDTEGMPQTNNNIEAYNLKLKKYLGNAHPDLYPINQ